MVESRTSTTRRRFLVGVSSVLGWPSVALGEAPSFDIAPSVKEIVLVIFTGQSNTQGAENHAVVTSRPPAPERVLMFDNNTPRILGNSQAPGFYNMRVEAKNLQRLVGARERVDGSAGETISTMSGYELQKRLGPDVAVVVVNVAIGSQDYGHISEGSVIFANAVEVIERVRMIAKTSGRSFRLAVNWSGQEGNVFVKQAKFHNLILKLHDSFARRFDDNDGDTAPVIMCIDGIAAFPHYRAPPGEALAQLQAAVDDPKAIAYATPTYVFPTCASGVHKTAAGAAHEGAYFGRATALSMRGEDARPLYPVAATLSGSKANATLHVPKGPLTRSTIVSDPGNLGITCSRQDNGALVPLKSASIAGPDKISVELDSPPDGVSLWLEFALRGPEGAPVGPTSGARSPLCDSSLDRTFYGLTMQNHIAISRVDLRA